MQNLDLWTDEDLPLLLQLKKAVDTPKPRIFLLPDEDIITISNYLLQLRPNDIINVDKTPISK